MKRIFVLAMIIGFIWALPTMAWQDPCNATDNSYEYEGFVLGDWIPAEPMVSPAPECEGTVILRAPDGMWYQYDYVGDNGILIISDILPCRVSDKGNLVCKIVTKPAVPAVPEESDLLILNQQE